MEIIIYLIAGILIGSGIGWLLAGSKTASAVQAERDTSQQRYSELEKRLAGCEATARANLQAADKTILEKNESIETIKKELEALKKDFFAGGRELATALADNRFLAEKLQTQQVEMEALNKKLTVEFENIANKILDTKTEKFTQLNRDNLKAILDPLGKNLTEFKEKVEDVYVREAKERFSLGEKVKELALLNQVISEEARNLTKALKGESKTQGRWGEVVLETILEKSGLRKEEEFFMEYQLYDAAGNPLRSEAKGRKMRPDAVVKYPDQRHVIIDAKVSLNAYVRFTEATEAAERQQELAAHVLAIKNHITDLSGKAYDDYDKALDFVMLFIPNEAAYIAAMQGDAGLWEFVYTKRILLISPTNLITSLKLIVDLWKREYQNQNARAIAERGAKLYDKLVGFVDNLEAVGKHLDNAQSKYQEAYRQLHTGNDNLITQAVKLKKMGLKTKKELGNGLLEKAEGELWETENPAGD